MTRSVVASLTLLLGLVVTGCSDSPTCDELESLTEELAETEVDDPGYNDLVSQAKQAEADCNRGGGY